MIERTECAPPRIHERRNQFTIQCSDRRTDRTNLDASPLRRASSFWCFVSSWQQRGCDACAQASMRSSMQTATYESSALCLDDCSGEPKVYGVRSYSTSISVFLCTFHRQILWLRLPTSELIGFQIQHFVRPNQ